MGARKVDYGKYRNHQDPRIAVTVFYKDDRDVLEGYLEDSSFDGLSFEVSWMGILHSVRWENVDRVEVQRP